MIGDWVCYDKPNNYYTQVNEICKTNDWEESYIKCIRSQKDSNYPGIKDSFNTEILHPIPLTGEILEKNGFFRDAFTNLSPDFYFNDDVCSIYINLNSTHDKSKEIWIENIKSMHGVSFSEARHASPKKELYVHELQHMFRLSGIDKKIEL